MTLTEQQKQSVLEHTHAIFDYISKEIMPKLTDQVEVGFGKTYYPVNHYATQYSIYVSKDEFVVRSGLNTWQDLLTNDDWLSWETNFRFDQMIAILENWGTIKSKLLQAVNKQQQLQTFIQNFAV